MKKFLVPTLIMSLNFIAASAHSEPYSVSDDGHRGGNGGDVYEIDLQKRIKKIGKFINSTVGKQVYGTINNQSVEDMAMNADLNLTSDTLFDKFGKERACINMKETSTITCTTDKLVKATASTLDVILTHELFGLLDFETGLSDDSSNYLLSSKVADYTRVINAIELDVADIYPEYAALDSKSYGITFVNKATHESLRMICLNDNVAVNRCKNLSVVRSAKGLQAPLMPHQIANTPDELASIALKSITSADIEEALAKIQKLKDDGYDYISIGKNSQSKCGGYAVGTGLTQLMASTVYGYSFIGEGCIPEAGVLGVFIPLFDIPYLIGLAVDVPTEAIKQGLNVAIYPFKAIISTIKLISSNGVVANYKTRQKRVSQLLNLESDLSLVDTTKKLTDKQFRFLISDTINALQSIK